MKSKQQLLAEQLRLTALLPQAEAELKRYPGVVSVSVGAKETANAVIEELVFRVYVVRKKPRAELAADEMIPDQVLGVPTDVNEVLTPTEFDDDSKYRPIVGGVQIANEKTGAMGTLACLAQLNSDGSIVALSNHHVMMDGNPTLPENIGQPSVSCCCCCKGNIIGEVLKSQHDARIDCAIARITGTPGFSNEILDIGLVFGSVAANPDGTTVTGLQRVLKRGRTTGLTIGTVMDPNAPTNGNPATNTPPRTGQILIRHVDSTKKFSEGGDSGSAIVDEQNVVVGLLWGGVVTGGVKFTFACRITEVVAAMGITVLNSGTADTIPLGSAPSAEELAESQITAAPLAVIADELRKSQRGRSALAFFDKYGREINDLLNTNRTVKVAWHRFHGPEYTAHVIHSAREHNHRIPSNIEGVSPANLLIRMSVVLQEEGSPDLASAAEEMTVPLLHLVSDAATVRDMLQRIRDEETEAAEPEMHDAAV